MKKLWSFTKKLRPIKGIVNKPNMSPHYFAIYDNKLYFVLVNNGGDCSLIYEFDPIAQDGNDIFEEGGIIDAAPVMNGKIYFFSSTNYRCFDLRSKSLAFEYDKLLDYDFYRGTIYIDDNAYFSTDINFICADKETGTEKWKLDFSGDFYMLRENIIFHDYNKKAVCVNKAGKILWETNFTAQFSCMYGDNIILCDEQNLYLIDGHTGEILANHKDDFEFGDVMTIDGGIFYGQCKYIIDGKSFKKVWQIKIKGKYIATERVLHNGKIFFFDDKNILYITDIESGHTEMEKLDTVKKVKEIFIEDGKLYVFGKNVELDCFEV